MARLAGVALNPGRDAKTGDFSARILVPVAYSASADQLVAVVDSTAQAVGT